jgi:hypothetical protein
MLRKETKHGFSQADWDAGKEEARAIMIDRAKVRGMITYSNLVKQIKRTHLEPHDSGGFFNFLGRFRQRKMLRAVEC